MLLLNHVLVLKSKRDSQFIHNWHFVKAFRDKSLIFLKNVGQ
jgi:hypothetical protein